VSSRKTYQGVETVYSYDPHGNVAWVYQNLPGLGGNFIGYDYDLISNRVKQVLYDEQHGDQFYQRYGYDEDGRVTTVESSRDSVIWDRDAEYSYFLHGPLMRIELGEDRLQGLDYTHTIHGWLKAINHPALSIDTTLDPGHDNGMERTAPDVFGMILNYYEGDYLRSYNSGADQSPFNSKTVGSSTEQAYQLTSRNLYNGNISGWSLRTTPVGTPSIPAGQTAPALLTHESLVGYSFRYDVLNRLRTSSFSYYSQGSTSAWNNMGTADYYMSLAYDPNGNIDSMTRHGYAKPGGSVAMDNLTYSYPTTPGSETNRLRHVKDSESAGYYSNDIDDEPDDNYLYDPSGNLIYDQSEGTLIRWNAQGKVTQVRKITATVKKDLIYIYDGAGERIAKKELDYLAAMDSSWVTYYVRDAGEKVIAVYRQKLHYSDTSDTCPPGVPGSGMDTDADGIDETPPNFCDNCNSTITPTLPPEFTYRNPWQEDYDGDGIGDACDPCPFGPGDECGTPLSDTAVVPMSKWIPSGFAVLAEWHIYGSSIQGRVGIWKPEKNRDTSLVSDTIFTRTLSMKEYELKDHLGNVTVVISDLKTATTGGGAPFGVDVKSFSHYYPFGMLHPGAFGSNREYRFGYNGKESDNDWKGEGNVYDYGFRVYDPRIGKFLSIDPIEENNTGWGSYVYTLNTPIRAIDPDGRVVLFFNGRNGPFLPFPDDKEAESGGSRAYWREIRDERVYAWDKLVMDRIRDHKARYYDGAGGPGNTIAAKERQFNPLQRFTDGFALGQSQASAIIMNLESGESIKIVSHSMGAMFGRGFMFGVLSELDNVNRVRAAIGAKPIERIGLFEMEIAVSPLHGDEMKQVNGMITFTMFHDDDDLSKKHWGDLHRHNNRLTPHTAPIPGTMRIEAEKTGGHGVLSFGTRRIPSSRRNSKGTSTWEQKPENMKNDLKIPNEK
jgi:RHS repeat-associated protein